MAVRRLVKALEKNVFSDNNYGLRMAVRRLVKVLETFFFSDNDYFPKIALEWL